MYILHDKYSRSLLKIIMGKLLCHSKVTFFIWYKLKIYGVVQRRLIFPSTLQSLRVTLICSFKVIFKAKKQKT